MEKHLLMDGKLHLYKRPESKYWQCSTYLSGKNRRKSTDQDTFAHAKEVAEHWYFGLRGKVAAGLLKDGYTFEQAAKQFEREYVVITQGQRSEKYVETLKDKLRVYLVPYFGSMILQDITPGKVQEYRVHRTETSRTGKPPARSTLHQEIVALRQVLKTAHRHGWLAGLPDLSPPYKMSGKVSHRAWFSPAEYKQLYQATRRRAEQPLRARWKRDCEELHDYVLFMANTGLRPDEAKRLEFRDVEVVQDQGSGETILVIEVRGKRGVGYCKSTSGAVRPFERVRARLTPAPMDLVFPRSHRELLNRILDEEKLKLDRDGRPRTSYSLRHTYICLRLMEGADIYQIAKNCRTSVEMIEKFYAVHLKNTLDAAAINVRRSQAPRSAAPHRRRRRNTKNLASAALSTTSS